MKKVLATNNAPAAIGPYSQAIHADKFVFVSGQLPSLTNIKNILESDGLSMANVVKTTVLLNNIADFGAMNEVYATFFEGACPARAAFEVAALPKGALVEIEAIAYAE